MSTLEEWVCLREIREDKWEACRMDDNPKDAVTRARSLVEISGGKVYVAKVVAVVSAGRRPVVAEVAEARVWSNNLAQDMNGDDLLRWAVKEISE